MIPKIQRVKVPYKDGGEKAQWVVEGDYGWDICDSLFEAIVYWLWRVIVE